MLDKNELAVDEEMLVAIIKLIPSIVPFSTAYPVGGCWGPMSAHPWVNQLISVILTTELHEVNH